MGGHDILMRDPQAAPERGLSWSTRLLDISFYLIANVSWWSRDIGIRSDKLPFLNGILNFFDRRPSMISSVCSVNGPGRLILLMPSRFSAMAVYSSEISQTMENRSLL
jgi:hypothetical protein